uniref:Uncharacterized protein n=1 Tax=Haptolina ericina TaxID=156174 RepID=A0A7S3FJ33_9EUKA|mmetsp:Transcript_72994/g.162162  ORF Transcript_72994/g.162162 Transcript_72994/m.162162 type:complete len:123 (+) Transcript_72994:2-370(+)
MRGGEPQDGMGAMGAEGRPAVTASAVACSISGVACWPRLVLDEGGMEGEQPIIVEARGMEAEPRFSSWQTVLLLLDKAPARIHAGDTIVIESEIELGAAPATPPRYTMKATIDRRAATAQCS